MKVKDYSEEDPMIVHIKARRDESAMVINFKWPNRLKHVCIYKRDLLKEEAIDWQNPYRKYTQEEYKSFSGFRDGADDAGLFEYIICPLIAQGDEMYVIGHIHSGNVIRVAGGKIKVGYTLKEKKKLFNPTKTVQMTVFCDTDIPKEYICYTKKRGSVPKGREDGMQFQFLKDFYPGCNVLPEIEIDKDEYIRLYLTEDVKYKELYWVYKQ